MKEEENENDETQPDDKLKRYIAQLVISRIQHMYMYIFKILLKKITPYIYYNYYKYYLILFLRAIKTRKNVF